MRALPREGNMSMFCLRNDVGVVPDENAGRDVCKFLQMRRLRRRI